MMESAPPRVRSLTLTLTEKCNLRCAYCYAPAGGARDMSGATADAAVDFLARHADPEADEVTLSFFGGEPFLAPALLARAVDRARAALDGKRRLRVVTPTNAIALRGDALDLCRSRGIELAVSIDGEASADGRRHPDGRSAAAAILDRVPDLVALGPAANLTARMTVTPEGADRLAASVRAVARLGFRRVVYQPAFERPWTDAAVHAWGREHVRIGTWLLGARSAGARVPDLPAWRAVEDRLARGRPRRACGAGRTMFSVSTDGGLFPCFRLVFRGEGDGCRLGDVRAGFANRSALDRFAAVAPDGLRPEAGDCSECPSRDGCIHFCPAIGWLSLGDPRGVPRDACRLAREQVEAIRPFVRSAARPARRPVHRGLAAAVVVAAAATAATAAACGGSSDNVGTKGGQGGDASADGQYGGGVCPVQSDAKWDTAASDADAGAGGDVQVADGFGPGICDPYDAGPDYGGGGVCPNASDSGKGGGGGCIG